MVKMGDLSAAREDFAAVFTKCDASYDAAKDLDLWGKSDLLLAMLSASVSGSDYLQCIADVAACGGNLEKKLPRSFDASVTSSHINAARAQGFGLAEYDSTLVLSSALKSVESAQASAAIKDAAGKKAAAAAREAAASSSSDTNGDEAAAAVEEAASAAAAKAQSEVACAVGTVAPALGLPTPQPHQWHCHFRSLQGHYHSCMRLQQGLTGDQGRKMGGC